MIGVCLSRCSVFGNSVVSHGNQAKGNIENLWIFSFGIDRFWALYWNLIIFLVHLKIFKSPGARLNAFQILLSLDFSRKNKFFLLSTIKFCQNLQRKNRHQPCTTITSPKNYPLKIHTTKKILKISFPIPNYIKRT